MSRITLLLALAGLVTGGQTTVSAENIARKWKNDISRKRGIY